MAAIDIRNCNNEVVDQIIFADEDACSLRRYDDVFFMENI